MHETRKCSCKIVPDGHLDPKNYLKVFLAIQEILFQARSFPDKFPGQSYELQMHCSTRGKALSAATFVDCGGD